MAMNLFMLVSFLFTFLAFLSLARSLSLCSRFMPFEMCIASEDCTVNVFRWWQSPKHRERASRMYDARRWPQRRCCTGKREIKRNKSAPQTPPPIRPFSSSFIPTAAELYNRVNWKRYRLEESLPNKQTNNNHQFSSNCYFLRLCVAGVWRCG